MRILVIDDQPGNQESARATLAEHDLTVVGTVEEAFALFKDNNDTQFDVVLTDLWMPTPQNLRAECGESFLGVKISDSTDAAQIDAGVFFVLAAVVRGVKYVGIVTDSSHHSDRRVVLLDLIDSKTGMFSSAVVLQKGLPVTIRKFEKRNYRTPNHAKNWGKVLRCLLEDAKH